MSEEIIRNVNAHAKDVMKDLRAERARLPFFVRILGGGQMLLDTAHAVRSVRRRGIQEVRDQELGIDVK